MVGETVTFGAQGFDQNGNPIDSTYNWRVSGGGTIDETGVFTATTNGGPFTITAESESISGSAVVNVTAQPVLDQIVVSSPTGSVAVGNTMQFTAEGFDQFGGSIAIPSLSWRVSGGGTIDESGLFNATTIGGPYVITASTGSISATSQLSVTEQLSHLVFDDFNQIDSNTVGSQWTEVESSSEGARRSAGALLLTPEDQTMMPQVKTNFPLQTSGIVEWRFDMNWSRTAGESVYELLMQLGDGMVDIDEHQGVAVALRWGDNNGGFTSEEGFGYVLPNGGDVQVAQTSGISSVSVIVNLDTKRYSISVDGDNVASDVPFRTSVGGISQMRFVADQINRFHFSGMTFDNVKLTTR